ncbi:MAG: PhnE/PtxC family ABC transporter permease [Pyrobaculum sp.]
MVIPLLALLTIVLGLAVGLHAADWGKAFTNLAVFLSNISLEPEVLHAALYALYETLVMSIFATAAAVLISVPLAGLSAGNLSPTPLAITVRSIATFFRTIPALLWAVVAVVMFGPGQVAGALALTIYSVGYLTKLYYETFENVDAGFLDAMRAMGARGIKLIHLTYLQQRRQFITNTIFIFEYNVRTATIIGFVGAGGVGYYIAQYLSLLRYDAVVTIVLITLVFVLALEGISYLARRR